MSIKTLNLSDELYDYLMKISSRENSVAQALRQKTAQLSTYKMQSSPELGQFMSLLIQLMSARKTLDIGVYTGYSALSVALALPSDGKVIALDVTDEWETMARDSWQQAGVADKIDLQIAPALQTLDELIANGESGSFDFAFIDADKANYINYYEKSLQLLRKGSLIIVDNVLWSGRVIDQDDQDSSTKAIRQFNQTLHHDDRVTLSMLPIGDGVTLAMKR